MPSSPKLPESVETVYFRGHCRDATCRQLLAKERCRLRFRRFLSLPIAELFVPVLDDADLGRYGGPVRDRRDHQEPLAVGGYLV